MGAKNPSFLIIGQARIILYIIKHKHYYNSIMKILIVCLLVALSSCNYNATIAKKLAIASEAAYATDAEISKWSCKVCDGFPLIKTEPFTNNILDIHGYTGYSQSESAIIVAFKGQVDIQNWIANLDATQVTYPGCSGCLVHQGFYNAFMGVEGYVRKNVQTLSALFRGAKIWVTGFSLGGALGVLAALDIKEIFGNCDQFYSFGMPRVGNEALSTYMTSHVPQRFRVIHYADIAPHIPPQIPIPYSHFANEVWYDEAMSKFKVCGAEEFTCSKSILPNQWSTKDHDMVFYMKIVGAYNDIEQME